MKKDYCIVEELICEEEFLKKLYEFINKTNADHYWFRVMRKLKDLLEVESKRDRKIKNTVEDFNKLKEDTEALKIQGEYLIKNDDLDLTANKILNFLR